MGLKNLLLSLLTAKLFHCSYAKNQTGLVHSALKGTGTTTRGWSCCKNSCSWSGKAAVSNPVISCDNTNNLLANAARRDGCDSGGGAFACSDLSPWAASNDLSYGYAGVNLVASNETAWCCSCYNLTFTSGPVTGKKMTVQIVNTGNDLGDDQFDLAIPGGGQGTLQGCSKEFGGTNVWGQDYGGISHREDCDVFPEPLKGGCYWRFDWFRNADNPTVTWEKTTCPESLSYVSNCRRNDDPVPGKNTPTPSTTKSAPVASGTVTQGGQCGGSRYTGPTVCVSGTVCTFVSADAYYCLPDPASTRTTPTTTSPTPIATIGQPWDQCGGPGWIGPTRCKDSTCISLDPWYWQCQPSATAAPTSTPAPNNPGVPVFPSAPGVPGLPPWASFTRPPRTWPGTNPQPTSQPAPQPQPQPGTPTSKSAVPPPPGATTIGQLYDQCAGATFQGKVRCAEGLICAYMNAYYSQCEKPSK